MREAFLSREAAEVKGRSVEIFEQGAFDKLFADNLCIAFPTLAVAGHGSGFLSSVIDSG